MLELWKAYCEALASTATWWMDPAPPIQQEPDSNVIAFRKTKRKSK